MNIMEDRLQRKIYQWLETEQQVCAVSVDNIGAALGSTIGLVRKENQDRAVFIRVRLSIPVKHFFIAAILCDGMGGMLRGRQCATLAVSTFATSLVRSKETSYTKMLEVAAHKANQAVYKEFSGHGGTTLSAVIVDEHQHHCGINVGDSRIYQMLLNGKVEQLSVDDTIEGQLEAYRTEPSSYELRQLVQFIGMGKDLEPHHIKIGHENDPKLVFITSDGVHNIPHTTMQQLVANSSTPRILVERLIRHSEWIGGKDNATAIVIPVNADSGISGNEDSVPGTVEIWSLNGKVEIWTPDVLDRTTLEENSSKPKDQELTPSKQSLGGKEASSGNPTKSRSTKKIAKKEAEQKRKNNGKDHYESSQNDHELDPPSQLIIQISDES